MSWGSGWGAGWGGSDDSGEENATPAAHLRGHRTKIEIQDTRTGIRLADGSTEAE